MRIEDVLNRLATRQGHSAQLPKGERHHRAGVCQIDETEYPADTQPGPREERSGPARGANASSGPARVMVVVVEEAGNGV